MTRDELIERTRQLVAEGDRLEVSPSLGALQVWLKLSDDLLVEAWGSMDRYHLSWLMVGKPKSIVRGRPMTAEEEAAYVREVAAAKTAALRMSLDAVERQGMPFRGEDGGVAPGQGMGEVPLRGLTIRGRVPAVGGQASVPAPDPIARDYLLLALRLDQLIPGLVDAYFGPADLKARVDLEPLASPARLLDDARALLARVPGEVADPMRERWLTAQLVALETQTRALAGDPLPYRDHVARCFDFEPERRSEALFAASAAAIGELLPGDDPIDERLAAWDARFTIPVDRLPAFADVLVARYRERALALFGAPDGDSLRVGLVTGQPWTGYNWYDGSYRSRVDLNTDVPLRVAPAARTLAHETYPGHHLEHAWKDAARVQDAGEVEASALLINAPECLISEGLAEIGYGFVVPPEDEVDLLVELFGVAGLPIVADLPAARDAADRSVAIERHRHVLRAVAVNAALMRHVDDVGHDDVLAYLRTVGLMAPDRAAQRLSFIEHPLWRTYVFVYTEGEELLQRWLDLDTAEGRTARFGRLLRESLTPGSIAEDVVAG